LDPFRGVQVSPAPPPAAEIAAEQAKVSQKAFEKLSIEQRQDELAEMFATDPVQAEKLLASGDLTDDGFDAEEA
jgi:hypothetical protein